MVRARPPAHVLVFAASILILSLSSEGLSLSPRVLLTAFPLVYGLAYHLRPASLGIAVGSEAPGSEHPRFLPAFPDVS